MSAAVKAGYKQTEVGVIPEEWEVTCVGDSFEVCNNFRLPISQVVREQMIGDYPYYGPTNVQGWINEFRVEGEFALIGEDGDHFLKWRIQPMTQLVRGRFNVNNHAHLVRGSKNLTEWFYWFFVNRDITASLTRQGASRYKLNKATLLQLPCVLPPPPEQRAIAEALSDVDALLGALDRLIAKKCDLKQAAMQQLLTGQTRLSGFHGEWKRTRLKNLVTADKFAIVDGPFGSQLKVEEYVKIGVPIIEMEHLVDKSIAQPIERCVTPKKFDELKRSAVYPGDILISKTGSLGKLGIIPDSIERGLITSRLAKITLEPSRADRNFVFQCLLKNRRDGYWEKVSQGGTMQILGIGMLQNTPIPDVSLPEQTAIAEVLNEMDAELAGLEQRREKTRALKQGMMQELLTGKTRLV